MSKQTTNWYDYPQYFEMAFADETKKEANFFEEAFEEYVSFPVKRLIEPGCGGGRLVVEMARRGYDVTGLDASKKAVAYLRRRIKRANLPATAIAGDMREFQLDKLADAAFCTFNTFRHLTTEKCALDHLRCVAKNLEPGGIYILGLHLIAPFDEETCVERWTAQRGKTKATFTLRVLSMDRRRRLEQIRISMLVRNSHRDLRLRTEFEFRLYNANQFRRLLKKVPEFELCDVFDFWYEIDEPLELSDEISDSVFVLRKR